MLKRAPLEDVLRSLAHRLRGCEEGRARRRSSTHALGKGTGNAGSARYKNRGSKRRD